MEFDLYRPKGTVVGVKQFVDNETAEFIQQVFLANNQNDQLAQAGSVRTGSGDIIRISLLSSTPPGQLTLTMGDWLIHFGGTSFGALTNEDFNDNWEEDI